MRVFMFSDKEIRAELRAADRGLMDPELQHDQDGPDEPLSLERYDDYDHDVDLDQDQDMVYDQDAGLDSLAPDTEGEQPW